MKKLLPWVSWFAILLLTACSLPSSGGSQPPVGASTATLSPAQVETQISAMLTLMPTNAGEQAASKASPTPGLPTVSVVTATAEGSPAATEAAAQATDTPPAQEPTSTAQSPAVAPTPTATPTVSSGAAGGGQDLPADWNSATGVDHLDNAQHRNWPTGSDQYTLPGSS